LEEVRQAVDEADKEQRAPVLSLAEVKAEVTKQADNLDLDSRILSAYHPDAKPHSLANVTEGKTCPNDAPWRRSLVTDAGRSALFPGAPSMDVSRVAEEAERLRRLFHPNCERASTRARERMDKACERLAEDLALSSQVFLTTTGETGEKVKAADGNVDVDVTDFTFLRPSKTKDGGEGNGPLVPSDAARQLVSEWTLGEPFPDDDYVYEDPYGEPDPEKTDEQLEAYRERLAQGNISASQPTAVSRRKRDAAAVVPTEEPEAIFARHFIDASSQPEHHHDEDDVVPPPQPPPPPNFHPEVFDPLASSQMSSFSQPPALSQIVPGAHANRKKKRKRIGGF
jgi:hypothetical protein